MSNGSKIAAGIAAPLLMLPVLLAIAVVGAVSAILGTGGATALTPCTITGVPARGVAGYGPDQITNAATIAVVGRQMRVPERGIVIAIATAMQESRLRNLDHGDRDSLGLFQQRPSQGWGTPAQITNPTYAAATFYRHLLAVPGWQHMTLNDTAQTVQRSGTPNAYGQHEPAARAVAAAVRGATCTPPRNAGWVAPVTGRCTSGFGSRNGVFHYGQDIAAPIGTPIVAASSGTVLDSGPASGYGLWIKIEHANGVVTTYGHNNRNVVQPAQQVRTGQPIAAVGNRGQSTGPHLHFQIEISGNTVNPVSFYRQRSARPLCE